MVAQWSITGYFGAPVKQPRRKGNPSAKDTGVIEKKHGDSPTVRVWKFQEYNYLYEYKYFIDT